MLVVNALSVYSKHQIYSVSGSPIDRPSLPWFSGKLAFTPTATARVPYYRSKDLQQVDHQIA